MTMKEIWGIVDDKLKVWGVRGPRVVDASVFPKRVALLPKRTGYAGAGRRDFVVAGHTPAPALTGREDGRSDEG